MINLATRIGAWRTIRRFLLATAVGTLMWEIAHLPLYTVWLTESRAKFAYDILHCTVGGALIVASSLAVAVAVLGWSGWPS